MKKILLVLLLALIFTGCASIPAEGENGAEGRFESGSSEGREYGSSSAGIPGDYPGTYTVPEGWVKSKEHSSAAKFFYVKAGQEKDAQPDNILVNEGKNKYSVSESRGFSRCDSASAVHADRRRKCGAEGRRHLYGPGLSRVYFYGQRRRF